MTKAGIFWFCIQPDNVTTVGKSIGFVGFFPLKSEDFFRWVGFRPEVVGDFDPLKAIQGKEDIF